MRHGTRLRHGRALPDAKHAHDGDDLCATRNAALLPRRNDGAPVATRIEAALDGVAGTLRADERGYV